MQQGILSWTATCSITQILCVVVWYIVLTAIYMSSALYAGINPSNVWRYSGNPCKCTCPPIAAATSCANNFTSLVIYITLLYPQHLRILIGQRQQSPQTGPRWHPLVPAQEVTSSTQVETSLSHHKTTWSLCWRNWGWSSSTHYFRLEVVGNRQWNTAKYNYAA